MFFLALVGAPVLRTIDPPRLRAALFRRIGERFRGIGWLSIAVLVATGIVNLHFKGLLTASVWSGLGYWTTTAYGRVLGVKLVLVAAMLLVQAVHDFWLGPKAGRLSPGTPPALRARRGAAWLARVNGLLGLALVYAAVVVARGV